MVTNAQFMPTSGTLIPISEVEFDKDIYPRQRTSAATIERYVEALESGAIFPPIALLEGTNTLLDGAVFDPFAGSGTTLSAAKKIGRHYIGAELDPEWHKVAERRVNAADEQGDLFSFSKGASQ